MQVEISLLALAQASGLSVEPYFLRLLFPALLVVRVALIGMYIVVTVLSYGWESEL